jgi:hypothetical protein
LRWALQSASREILFQPGQAVEKQHRICFCHRNPVKTSVEILKATKFDTFHYSGLQTCGSLWVCPVCAGKISERRKDELTQGFQNWKAKGGGIYMLTLTAPHHAGQSLSFLTDAMSKAFRIMKNRKAWKRLMDALKLAGSIRGLEVTQSFVNGWHVHFHVILFFPIIFEGKNSMEETMYEQWRSACLSVGLDEPSRAHGVKWENGDQAEKYVSKWGLEAEVTKSHIKQGREGHHTPFDFLRLYLQGDERYGALFREYAEVFKGKKQLIWSRGLRDLLGLGQEQTDEEIAEQEIENAQLFAEIPLNVWRRVLARAKTERGVLGKILAEVCPKGLDALHDFLIELWDTETAGAT